jgi:RNA recognition motif-containing protein
LQHLHVANGGLGNNVSRDVLTSTFSTFGEIIDIVMIPAKPYAFVSFSDVNSSETALQSLQGMEISSREMLAPVKLYLSFIKSGQFFIFSKIII